MPSTGGSWTLTGKSGSVSCGITAPFSWVLMWTRFCLCPPRVFSPSPVEVLQSNPTCLQSQIPWGFSVPLPDPQVGKSVVGPRTFLTVQTFLWYNYSAVCGLSAWQLYGGANDDLLQEGLHHRLCDPGSCTHSPSPCGRPLLTCNGQHWNQTDYILCSQRWRSSIQSEKARLGADCGSDHELLIAKFRLKLKNVEKTSRPFWYDLHQIPYDYTVDVTDRFKGLDLVRVPEELWTQFRDIVQEAGIKTIPMKKKCKKGKMVVWGGLTHSSEKKRS